MALVCYLIYQIISGLRNTQTLLISFPFLVLLVFFAFTFLSLGKSKISSVLNLGFVESSEFSNLYFTGQVWSWHLFSTVPANTLCLLANFRLFFQFLQKLSRRDCMFCRYFYVHVFLPSTWPFVHQLFSLPFSSLLSVLLIADTHFAKVIWC